VLRRAEPSSSSSDLVARYVDDTGCSLAHKISELVCSITLAMTSRLSVAVLISLVVLALFMLPWLASPRGSGRTDEWPAIAADRYHVFPDLTYSSVNGIDLKLDVYMPWESSTRTPVVVYFHGGGWVMGDKDDSALQLLPYMRMGWAAVNVNYRLASVAPAPAALEDSSCALRWLTDNANKYRFDLGRVVLTGHSAGGYIALMEGILPESSELNGQCRAGHRLKAAAIVNWFGITDVYDLVSAAHRRSFAVQWLGNRADRDSFAKQLSPVSYLRSGLPPIITIHGDADPTVPFVQAVKLHKGLSQAGTKNRLVEIAGGKHGWFTAKQDQQGYSAVQEFLSSCGLRTVAPQ